MGDNNERYIFNEHSSIRNFLEEKHFYKIICNLRREGYSCREIAKLSEVPEKDILRIIELFKDESFR